MQLLVREIRPDEVEQEVTQRDQFNTDTVGLSETLVREAHQNSVDGRSRQTHGPVRTRLTIKEARPEDAKFWLGLFQPLVPHLVASGLDVTGLDLSHPRLLIIEDFSTTGLLGATNKKDNGGFSDFWRRIGKSHKGGQQGGRWGLGKLVFSSASQIRTLFGLTIQETDPSRTPFLMGQSVIRHHSLNGPPKVEYAPHAFYGLSASDGLQVPVSDPSFIGQFVKASFLTRATEPGLSVVVSFVRKDITTDAMLPYLIRNWFFPILTGKLVVELGGLTVDHSNFAELATDHGGPDLRDGRLISFIGELNDAAQQTPTLIAAAKWPNEGIAKSLKPEELTALRDDYKSGKLVAVRAPITIRRKAGGEVTTHFDLFLRADAEIKRGEALYVRGALTIPGEARRFQGRSCFGALVASDKAIAEFLGDAEGPAHTTWSGTAEKVQEKWKNASARLKEIRTALNSFYDAAAEPGDRNDPDALIDAFFVRKSGTDQTKRTRNPIVRKPVVPPLPPSVKTYRIMPRKGGFVVRSTTNTVPPFQIRIRAAYDVMRGDPLKQYGPLDFDFVSGAIEVKSEGATAKAIGLNELMIDVAEPDFTVVVQGFDENRDVFIKAGR